MEKITGLLIIISSTTLYAFLYPLVKKASQQLPPFTVMAISMFFLFTLSLLGSYFVEGILRKETDVLKTNLPILAAIGIINFVAFWLLILSYKYFPVWQATMFTLLTPILAGIFAYFLLGEKFGLNLLLGLAVMAVGLFIAIR